MTGVVPVLLVVILSVLYDTNGLTLNDLYPYGEQNGDTAMTNGDLPTAPLLEPIDSLIGLGPHGLTATRYQVDADGFIRIRTDSSSQLFIDVLFRGGVGSNAQSIVYARVTNDTGLLRRAMNDINGAFSYAYCSSSPPTQLIITTWIDYKKTNSKEGSNFQLVIVTNGQATFGITQFINVTDDDEGSFQNGIYARISSTKQISTFPYTSNPETAPNDMLNSDVPGIYIFPLNSYDHASICKRKLIQLACESLRLKGETVPASCN